MNLYQQRVLDARKEFLKLNKKQEKELLRIYQELAKQLSNEIASCRTSSSKQYLSGMEEIVQAYMNELNIKLSQTIKGNIQASSQIASSTSTAYYESITDDIRLRSMFNKSVINTSANTVKKLIQGKYYEDGKTLNKRIWNVTQSNAKDIDTLIKVNVAKGANAKKLSQQLERYINPTKRIEAKTLEVGINKSISYQAQRLARTSITHAFSETTIENAKKNPFNSGIKWNLSASHSFRMHGKTDICDDYDGRVFKPNEIPLQHPNCLCYFTEENEDINKVIKDLKAWDKGKANPKLDKWYKNNKADNVLNDIKDKPTKEKKILFKPAKTIEEAERYSKKIIGIDADFKGMDLILANGINERTEKVLKVIPELKEVFTKQVAASKLIQENVIADSDFEIRYNLKYYKSFKKANRTYKDTLNTGFHPVGTDVHSTTTHELGHNLDSLLTNHGYGTPKKNSVFDNEASYSIKKRVLKKLKIRASDVEKGLSGYATKNPEEFLAEAITEYFDSSNPRAIAKTTWEEVEKLLKDMRSKTK